jgi:hypothetical protein
MAGPASQRASGRAPWLYGAIGALFVMVVILAIIIVMLLGRSGPGGDLAGASGTPTGAPTDVAVGSNGSGAPGATDGVGSPGASLPASPGATLGPVVTAGHTAGPTPGHTSPPATPRPSATPTLKPTIDSFTADPNYVTNCAPGSTITLSWLTTNADRVDIAVDIPAGESPLDHLYLDHQALDGSYSGLNYPCDAPFTDGTGAKYHNYSVIAYRGSAVVWKIIRVYVQPQV